MIKKSKTRNKERSKQRLIKAVGKILSREGYNELKINKISSVSGVNRKLIYDNFKSLDGLMKAYFDQVDYWKIEEKRIYDPIDIEVSKDFMFNLLKGDFEYLEKSTEMQKIILWGISEKNKTIRALTDEREEWGKKVFKRADEIFKNTSVDYRAIISVFVSSIYYMVLHAKTNGSPICEIDLSTIEGKKRIFDALLQTPVKLTTFCRFKLTTPGRSKLTMLGRAKLTT